MHLRQSFSSGCVQKKQKQNRTGKPLATQTMLIRAHPNDASDMTDNTRLVTGKNLQGPFFLEEDI